MPKRLTNQECAEILTTAIEGGMTAGWAESARITQDEELWITKATLYHWKNDDDEKLTPEIVTPAVIRRGVKLCLDPDFDIADDIRLSILTGDHDAISADCVVQAGLFGELVYG